MVPVRRHARHRSAYLAAGLIAVVCLSATASRDEDSAKKSQSVGDQPATEPLPTPTAILGPAPQRYVYPYPCDPPKNAEQDNLCIERGAAEEAKRSADWAEKSYYAGVASAVGLFLTLIATAGAAIGAFRSACAAEGAVKKSDAILVHAKESSEHELRAYVFVRDTWIRESKTGGPPRIRYSYRNTGKTPAKDVHVTARGFMAIRGVETDLTKLPEARKIGPLGPRDERFDDLDINIPLEISAHFYKFGADSVEIRLIGRIDYKDEFGGLKEPRWTTFHCYYLGGPDVGKVMRTSNTGNDYA